MKNLSFAIISLLFIGAGCFGSTADTNAPAANTAVARPLTEEQKETCGITVEVGEGPYYVSGTRLLTDGNLNYTGLSGNELKISGHVYEGLDETKPVAGATVDVWQADNDGSYRPNGNGPATKYADSQIALRGHVMTDRDGKYAFTTIYPGEYTGRARHIHVKVRAPGFEELTTQLIVPSLATDSITPGADALSRGLPDCYVLTIKPTIPASAEFDFRLAK